MTEPSLSTDGVAEHLGVTEDTDYTWSSAKGMPAQTAGAAAEVSYE